MTSKLKCPFCQQELGVILCDPDDFICPKCRLCGTESLWQALIQVRQDLEIATKALEKLKECLFQGGEQSVKLGVRVVAQSALEQIEHKE